MFTISRTGYVNQGVTLNYSISGAATSGDDYSGLTGSISFAAYQTTGQLTVVPVNDNVAETSESIIVTLTAGSGYSIGTPGQAAIILFDNDLPLVMVEHVNDAVEGGTDGKFMLTRLGDLTTTIEVGYTMSGSATNGTDYSSLSGSVTIPANQGSVPVMVDAIHDGIADGSESATLTLNGGSGYAVDLENDSGTVALIEADPLPVAFDGWVTTSIEEPIIIDALELATDLTPDELTVTDVSQRRWQRRHQPGRHGHVHPGHRFRRR